MQKVRKKRRTEWDLCQVCWLWESNTLPFQDMPCDVKSQCLAMPHDASTLDFEGAAAQEQRVVVPFMVFPLPSSRAACATVTNNLGTDGLSEK